MLTKEIPLEQYPSIRSRSTDEVENFVTSTFKATPLTFPKKGAGINLLANNYELSNSSIWFCSYGAPISLKFPDGDYFRIQFHYRGAGITKVGRNVLDITPQQAVVSHAAAQIDFGVDFQQIALRINRASLMRKITQLTGIELTRSLEFQEAFDPSASSSASLKKTLGFLLQTLDSPKEEMPSSVLFELEQAFITSLLYSCSNNYTDIIRRQSVSCAPWQVCRVEEYIEANWDKPIKMEDLLEITGCSARSIFRAFRKNRGYSPMAFAKRLRLVEARKILLSSRDTTVTKAALACGFTELGQFSKDYVQTFGELPSQTLRAIRRYGK